MAERFGHGYSWAPVPDLELAEKGNASRLSIKRVSPSLSPSSWPSGTGSGFDLGMV